MNCVVDIPKALIDFAVAASERPLVIDLLVIHALNRPQVIVGPPPCHHNRVGTLVVPHIPLDAGIGVLND